MIEFLHYYLSKKRSVVVALVGCGLFITIVRYIEERNEKSRAQRKQISFISSDPLSSASISNLSKINSLKVGVNRKFFEQLKILLPIVVPGLKSREAALLAFLTLLLFARTYLDIWFSGFNGRVVRSIVSRNHKAFVSEAILLFGIMMWPMSFVNNSLKLTINSLALSFRSRLTEFAHKKYLETMIYYKVANLDNRIQNADQLLTQDIEKFSENLAHLYSDIAKPIVDIFLFAYKLGQAIGIDAPVYMISYFACSGFFLRAISPPFGRYIAEEQKLEGEFRYAHSRIITHSEEIAFYKGEKREFEVVQTAYSRIVTHLKKVFKWRFLNGIIDSVCVKYYATMLAYFILSRPVFAHEKDTKLKQAEDPTKIMEEYSRNSGYLVNLSQAVGRLLLAGRDLTRFAGFTSRVSDFLNVLNDVNMGQYVRSKVKQEVADISKEQSVVDIDSRGTLLESDEEIEFQQVPIVTPNGDVLVPSLSLHIKPGMNCIITGPNGCGKSSLFRILGNLWPLYGGTLIRPSSAKLFYVPQRPYLPLGNLRTQIIYPDAAHDALDKGISDDALLDLLRIVRLDYLVTREGGWETIQDWADILSGGEKQRIAMARLFYHKPKFAILDECTSAVSVDVEGIMYHHAKKLGITLFTVSHRPSLFQYHEYLLKFDGQGGYDFMKLELDD